MASIEFTIGKTVVRLVKGDITDMDLDAIVNAANSSLLGGGGVDGAIHRRGGPKILAECRAIRAKDWPNGLPTGKAVITSGGLLKAKHIIYTVGPVWYGGTRGEGDSLASAYRSSLELALTNGLRSIAFPSISTGAYGFPIELAGRIAIETVKTFLEKDSNLSQVTFVLFSTSDFAVYRRLADQILNSK